MRNCGCIKMNCRVKDTVHHMSTGVAKRTSLSSHERMHFENYRISTARDDYYFTVLIIWAIINCSFSSLGKRSRHWTILRQLKSVQTLALYFSKIHFNVLFYLYLFVPSGLFLSGFYTVILYVHVLCRSTNQWSPCRMLTVKAVMLLAFRGN